MRSTSTSKQAVALLAKARAADAAEKNEPELASMADKFRSATTQAAYRKMQVDLGTV